MMDSWIWQPGYPLVIGALDGDELVLRQQRFTFGDADEHRRRRHCGWSRCIVRIGRLEREHGCCSTRPTSCASP